MPIAHESKGAPARRWLLAALFLGAASLPAQDFPPQPDTQAPAGMVLIPGGEFTMGATEKADLALCGAGGDPVADARPAHRVRVRAFWMDRDAVTNAQFAAFVAATHYATVAERPLRPEDFPGAPAEALVPGGVVFTPASTPGAPTDWRGWWRYQPGADWRHPTGPESSIAGRDEYPVVQVAYADAQAFAKWSGKRLPTEAEWERAARGGAEGRRFAWGDELRPGGRWMANIYEGTFPARDTGEDGYAGLAPVGRFPANPYGLRDMAGNVWQWCSDWYRPDTYARQAADASGGVVDNPTGPADSFDPAEPGVPKRVQRGGSYLCSDQYCERYLVGSRGEGDPDTASCHVGFRCVRDVEPPSSP